VSKKERLIDDSLPRKENAGSLKGDAQEEQRDTVAAKRVSEIDPFYLAERWKEK